VGVLPAFRTKRAGRPTLFWFALFGDAPLPTYSVDGPIKDSLLATITELRCATLPVLKHSRNASAIGVRFSTVAN